jgi:hypothetical protein
MNPVEIAALGALDLLVVVDNKSDTLSSGDEVVPRLPELGLGPASTKGSRRRSSIYTQTDPTSVAP